MTFSLQARVVFPVDRPAIEHGVVTIDGERTVSVGTKAGSGDVVDLGSVALVPGLVNCHTHLEFSHLRQPLGEPGLRLVDWIRLVIAERSRTVGGATNSIRAGLKESLRHGATTVGEIASATANAYGDVPGSLAIFAEVIGFSRARANSAFAAAVIELDALRRSPHAVGISPHAPYTVSPQLLSRLVALANERVLPVAMHLAESVEELELLNTGAGPFQELLEERSMWDAEAIPRGSRPLDYLRVLAEAPRTLVIHGNYLDDEEQLFLSANANRMSIIYCPRTHSYFDHPTYPLPDLMKRGVRVALGTDSRGSNPDLDLLAEMRFVAATFPTIDSATILRMGTLTGAEALGREAAEGSIAPGKLANVVAVPLQRSPSCIDEVLDELLASDEEPTAVWLRGRRMESGAK